MRARNIILAVFVFAAGVWLAGLIMNRPGCQQCTVLPPPPMVDEPLPASNAPSLPVASPTPGMPRLNSDSQIVPVPFSWDDTRDDILRSTASTADKADRLLALLPLLSGEAQEDAARHTANLLGDDHFLSAAACFTNAAAPTNVQAVFMADLLNRPEKVKLPLSLAVARNEEHPCAAQAREILQLYITDDLGTNWSAWETAIQARLQASP